VPSPGQVFADMRRPGPLLGRVPRTAVLALVLLVASPAAVATAAASPEQQLADRYAPVVALKKQTKACDSKGEPYRPVPVEVVLGRPDVRLEDSSGQLITTAPTAADLFGRGEDTYLDFPGSPLNPGCGYETWAKEISAGEPTTAYAHIVTEPGKPGTLALQYWFYYPFNDFNNKHESDWEMIQLMFNASTAAEALKLTPTEVGYSQHSGAERAAWSDPKLQKSGSHPVVFPGAGSHANYFEQRVWLGHGAQEGFGCDDTRGPSRFEQTRVVLLPTAAPTSPTAPFAWLGYEGHWGQKASGPNTGPTGPNMKDQWTEPVTWAEETWRAGSTAVPLQQTLGPSATSFFCGAVEAGSSVYLQFLRTPWAVLAVLTGIAAAGVWLSRRTRWTPVIDLPVDQERSGGQIYRAAWLLYRRHRRLLLAIGLVFVPLSVVAAILQHLVFRLTGIGTLVSVARSDPLVGGVVALLFGGISTIVATVLVTAAVAFALRGIDEQQRPGTIRAYKGIVPRLRSLGWAWLRIVVVAGLLTITVIGIPFAVVYLVRRAVVTQACVIEELDATGSLRRSRQAVRRHGLRVFAITGLVNTTAYLLGPILGVLLLFLTSSSLAFINLISSLVYVAVMPYVGIALALLFYDLRRRLGEEAAAGWG
jgi:hypothetical protein